MYIEPTSTIKILQDVPLDKTYEHTLRFGDKGSQAAYFSGKAKHTLSAQTYQRVKKGIARVGLSADSIYDCNYIMFQNSGFGAKWFYAFITAVEYVNNECSDVYFELDVMQTWYFDYTPKHCFVEREHSETDGIGDNIIPETIATGEYVYSSYEPAVDLSYMCVVLAIVDLNGTAEESSKGTLYDGIYGGATLWAYDSTDVDGINGKISEYAQKSDAIVSIYMIPKKLIGNVPASHKVTYGASAIKTTASFTAVAKGDAIDGYVPKNAKLYTYPYTVFHVDNSSGSSLVLRYELFENHKPKVEVSGTITQPVSVALRPCNYKGSGVYSELGGDATLNTEMLQLTNYPLCSWNVDSYQAWVAQNAIPLAIGAGTTLAGNVLSGNISPAGITPSGARSVIGEVSGLVSQAYTASIAADLSRGSINNGGVNVSNKKQQFYCGRATVQAQFARMIDDYFTRYGYATKRVKVPNRTSRPHWNYVKTVGFTATGSLPVDDMAKICTVYDNGVTFWASGGNVGNYSLDNSV